MPHLLQLIRDWKAELGAVVAAVVVVLQIVAVILSGVIDGHEHHLDQILHRNTERLDKLIQIAAGHPAVPK
jgi:hypothetical protein